MAYYLSNFFFKHNKTSISEVYFYLLTNQIPKLYVQNGHYPDQLTPLHKFTADICKVIPIKQWQTSKFQRTFHLKCSKVNYTCNAILTLLGCYTMQTGSSWNFRTNYQPQLQESSSPRFLSQKVGN